MHEMSVVSDIVSEVCKKAEEIGAQHVVAVSLTIGEARDIHESLLQRYFDVYSRGTKAEGVRVFTTYVPVTYVCSACGRVYRYALDSESPPACPLCPMAEVDIMGGTELLIDEIGVV